MITKRVFLLLTILIGFSAVMSSSGIALAGPPPLTDPTNDLPVIGKRVSHSTVARTSSVPEKECFLPNRAIPVLVVISFAGGFWVAWILVGRKKTFRGRTNIDMSCQPKQTRESSRPKPEAPTLIGTQTRVSIDPPIEIWPPVPKSGDGISDAWASFVADRLAETDPATLSDETKWALGVVDFLDELKESEEDASEAERSASHSLSDQLKTALGAKGFSLVDSDEWNPDKQRAVAVARKPDAKEPKILGKGSTGLSRNGKILRKQEVKLEMKGN